MVYRLAFALVRQKADADDIFQEVFLRYVKSAPTFQSEEHEKAWLLRVTTNCAKKHWSQAWFRRTRPIRDDEVFQAPEEIRLHEILGLLPHKYRSVIHLHYFEGYSTREIGEILGAKESTVRTWLTRARAKLRAQLKGESADDAKGLQEHVSESSTQPRARGIHD